MPAQSVQLVTGYPGFIGKRLVRRLAEEARGADTRLVLLVQPRNARAARADLEGEGIAAEVVEGDVEQMHLGLSGAEFKALAREVTDVWHLAARAFLVAGTSRGPATSSSSPPPLAGCAASTTSRPPTSPATASASSSRTS